MGALHAKTQQCNDAIILNQEGNVCDSTISNIFLIKDKRIFTPSLQQGCVAGTMRAFLIETLQLLDYEIVETAVSIDMLTSADEVFLTNAIYNIRWVKSIENNQYGVEEIQKIFYQLSKTNPLVIC
jgi:branched-chain amino acid aminotransferase